MSSREAEQRGIHMMMGGARAGLCLLLPLLLNDRGACCSQCMSAWLLSAYLPQPQPHPAWFCSGLPQLSLYQNTNTITNTNTNTNTITNTNTMRVCDICICLFTSAHPTHPAWLCSGLSRLSLCGQYIKTVYVLHTHSAHRGFETPWTISII